MNIENAIEIIRRSSALVWKKSFFWVGLLYMPMISVGFMMIGKMVGGFCYASGIGAVISCIIHFVVLLIMTRKSSPVKNKFIINFVSSCNTFFIFSFFYTAIHYELNLPEKSMVSAFVLSTLVPVCLILYNSRLLKCSEFVFRKKAKIEYTSMAYCMTGPAVAVRFLIGLIIKEYGHLASERMVYLIVMYVCLFAMLLMSANATDLWRYYYYTKLEKMGLVTEDILKPDK